MALLRRIVLCLWYALRIRAIPGVLEAAETVETLTDYDIMGSYVMADIAFETHRDPSCRLWNIYEYLVYHNMFRPGYLNLACTDILRRTSTDFSASSCFFSISIVLGSNFNFNVFHMFQPSRLSLFYIFFCCVLHSWCHVWRVSSTPLWSAKPKSSTRLCSDQICGTKRLRL